MERYSVLAEKNPREIVLLRGSGCKWKRCTFCDYHIDCCTDEDENFKLNKSVLDKVKGIYKKLEVINSGSFCDLDEDTMQYILNICAARKINTIHFECHWIHRGEVPKIKEMFGEYGINVRIKTGVETFDVKYRENILKKGFGYASPEKIREYADEVCLLFGLDGQTVEGMECDIETGLRYFDRVCVNIMTKNSTDVKPNENVIESFVNNLLPIYKDSDRVDILMENTDFGVGKNGEEVSSYE